MSDFTIKILIAFIFLIFPLYEFLSKNLYSFNIKNKNNMLYLSYISCLFLSFIKFYFVVGIFIFSLILYIKDYKSNQKHSANGIIPLIFFCFVFSNLFSAFIVKIYGLNLFTGYLPVYLYIIILFIFFVFSINYFIKIIRLMIDKFLTAIANEKHKL